MRFPAIPGLAAMSRGRRPGSAPPVGLDARESDGQPGPAFALPVRRRQVAVLVRQLAVMIGAGLPLAESLAVLHGQEDNSRLRSAVASIARAVRAGSSLASAMGRHPKVFDRLAVAMTGIGESSGRLDDSLFRLATELEKSAETAAKVRGAFAYPLVVCGIGVAVVAVILWRVVPVFTELYAGLDAELPLATRVVVSASESFGWWASAASVMAVASVAAVWRVRRSEAGGAAVDRLVLRVPLFGRLSHRAALARFCRTLSALTGAGVPILEGLQIARQTVGNLHLERAVGNVRERVATGSSLSRPLQATGLFPPMVHQMVAVGERTGELESALEKVAEFYEQEVTRIHATILPLLEPLLIVVLGAVIGGIVVAMYMPIWTLVGRLS